MILNARKIYEDIKYIYSEEKQTIKIKSPPNKPLDTPITKTMKKNISTENFMKFQWSWTI